jgi:TusA-related sulfurtransferase
MEELMVNVITAQELGDEWIQGILDKDFNHLATISHPDVKSILMVPSRIYHLENAIDLTEKVKDWFGDCDSIGKEQARVAMVGEKLAIFYRFKCWENGVSSTIEQQIYTTIYEGRIQQLRLICSGFQPDQELVDASTTSLVNAPATYTLSQTQSIHQADALLEFKTNSEQGSTCAMLTPLIKHKLVEMNSGQILEVHVDDSSAKEDIEAWSRLSGNILMKMDQIDGQGLVFYILKK